MNSPISITAMASLSALGSDASKIWENYNNENHFICEKKFDGCSDMVVLEEQLNYLRNIINLF